MYHYADNNPVRYIDPDGRTDDDANDNDFMDTGVYIINGHKKTILEKIDDEISRFAYRNIIEGGAYNADGKGDKWIRTMRGDMITLSRSGLANFSNREKDTDRLFFLLSWFGSELGLLFNCYPEVLASAGFGSIPKTGTEKVQESLKVFPKNPDDFNPAGLTRHDFKNGEIIKWMDKENKSIYEWNKDAIFGDHYHFTPDGKNRVPGITGNTHIKPGEQIP